MEDQENNEIKILIDALKYTSNIIVDLTNKLTIQEEKISILENKFNKIQKLSMENNLKLKTVDFEKINDIIKLNDYNLINKKKYNPNSSDEISEYIIEKKNVNTQSNKIDNTQSNKIDVKSNKIDTQSAIVNEELKDKNKIDKLIGSIVKRKNLLNQIINDNKEKSILTEHDYIEENIKNNEDKKNNFDIDLTIKTGTIKSEIINSKNLNNNENIKSNEFEQNKIISAQNNDLNKANNILKQIRRRANFSRKM